MSCSQLSTYIHTYILQQTQQHQKLLDQLADHYYNYMFLNSMVLLLLAFACVDAPLRIPLLIFKSIQMPTTSPKETSKKTKSTKVCKNKENTTKFEKYSSYFKQNSRIVNWGSTSDKQIQQNMLAGWLTD